MLMLDVQVAPMYLAAKEKNPRYSGTVHRDGEPRIYNIETFRANC